MRDKYQKLTKNRKKFPKKTTSKQSRKKIDRKQKKTKRAQTSGAIHLPEIRTKRGWM